MPKYTDEQQARMDDVAAKAAKREWETDKNRTDPKHTQDRVEAALHQYRVQIGLEKD